MVSLSINMPGFRFVALEVVAQESRGNSGLLRSIHVGANSLPDAYLTGSLRLVAMRQVGYGSYDPVPANTTAMVRRMILKSSHRLQFSI
jgi:hypothetical protein